jgi:hypothetical protein
MMAGVVMASLSAAAVHFSVVGEHLREYLPAGLFFLLLGTFQALWAALLAGRPTPRLYWVGGAVSLVAIALWAVSRTTGLPVGADPGVAEPASWPDILATLLEGFIVLGAIGAIWRRGPSRPLPRIAHRLALAATGGVVVPATLLAGAVGHHAPSPGAGGPSGSLGPVLLHHGSHLAFAGGAVAIYALYLVAHIRRYGWPSFSWSL